MSRSVSDKQRKQIEDTIRDHHLAFCAEVLGKDSIPKEDYLRLLAAGKIRPSKALKVDAATAAHVYGTLLGSAEEKKVEEMEPTTFWRMMTSRSPSLSMAEQEAVELARSKIGEYVKGLGAKVDQATGRVLIAHDEKLRRKRLTSLRSQIAEGLENRETLDEITKRVRSAVGDVKRNWLQIAQTEVHNVVEEGKAIALVAGKPPGDDPLVYKRPRPDACPYCKLLYLDKNVPRVFHLSELMANGSNVGRKAKRPTLTGPLATEWMATLDSVHPWCQCTLFHLPDGFGFDTAGRLVYIGVKKSAVEVQSLDKALLDHECGGE